MYIFRLGFSDRFHNGETITSNYFKCSVINSVPINRFIRSWMDLDLFYSPFKCCHIHVCFSMGRSETNVLWLFKPVTLKFVESDGILN